MQKKPQRKKIYILQIAWILLAITATILIVLCSDKLLSLYQVNGGMAERRDTISINLIEHQVNDSNQTKTAELPDDTNSANRDLVEINVNEDSDMLNNSSNLISKEEGQESSFNLQNDPEGKENVDNSQNQEVEGSIDQADIKQTKLVALTFDDGPYPAVTNRILDVLEQYNAKATFFVMGNRVKEYSSVLERAYELGCEIGSHTYSHKQLTKLKKEEILYEIEYTNQLINEIVDVGNVLLRPPYGSHNELMYKIINVPMINWSVDAEDWRSKDKDKVIEKVLSDISENDIILMHDLYSTTADAIEYLVPYLMEQGYEFVTVSELFEQNGKTLEAGKVYRHAK